MLCPICSEETTEAMINYHLDKGCPKRGSTQASTPDELAPPAKAPRLDTRPLAEKMRPKSIGEYVGQSHLVGERGVLKGLLERDQIPSLILWGPSGVGKTSFARLISQISRAKFVELSATTSGTAEVKNVVDQAKKTFNLLRQRTILFLDEIHRFNRTQQDSLLPSVERGDITLIGATTENPSFKLQGALLSRCQTFVLNKLSEDELSSLLAQAQSHITSNVDPQIVQHIAKSSNGDARMALNMLEVASNMDQPVDEILKSLKTLVGYDQKGDNHYDFISAFHKSIRGSDADAALYYLARMLQGGEDPLYISRRMVRMASEDIGLADDSCLEFAVACHTSVQQIGLPECDVMLAHCAVKLARAAKSVEVYKAFGALKAQLQLPHMRDAPIPMHLRNAPTRLMEEQGYSKGYKYNPDYVGLVDQQYLPEGVEGPWLGVFQPSKCDCEEGYCQHEGYLGDGD